MKDDMLSVILCSVSERMILVFLSGLGRSTRSKNHCRLNEEGSLCLSLTVQYVFVALVVPSTAYSHSVLYQLMHGTSISFV